LILSFGLTAQHAATTIGNSVNFASSIAITHPYLPLGMRWNRVRATEIVNPRAGSRREA